jgi:hypothetical protein
LEIIAAIWRWSTLFLPSVFGLVALHQVATDMTDGIIDRFAPWKLSRPRFEASLRRELRRQGHSKEVRRIHLGRKPIVAMG